MLRLDTTTTKLQALLAGAVATNALPVYVAYSDQATAYTGGKQVSTLSGTSAVDLCSAPAASTVRDIDYMSITNADTAAVTVTVRINDNGTLVPLYVCTLEIGERLEYVHGAGFRAMTSAGATKSGSVQDLSGYQQITGKDATGGYAGLTGFAINFKNLLGTIVSLFENANTAIRTYTWPDKSGTVAMTSDVVTDHTALSNIGTNTHAQIDTALTRLASTSGSNTGDQDLSGYQPLDSDLTAIAALTTTSYGRAFLALADAAAARTALSLGSAAVASLDLDGTMAANSDGAVPSQKAIRTYVANKLVGMLDLRGTTDCSASPNYPAASKGDAYYVSVAGKIGGASGKSVDAADFYVALADNAGGTEASVGASWFVLEHNLIGALLGSNNLSDVGSAPTALANIGGVPTTRTVAGHALSADVTVSASDVGLGSVTNDAQTKAAVMPNTAPAAGRIPVGNAGGTAYAPVAMSGDATLASTGAITLKNSGVTAATYGDATHVPQVTFDAQGRATGVTSVAITAGAGLTANTFTGAQEVDIATSANTSADGLNLFSTSAATSGNQQFSPRIHLKGFGWKTTATAASQSVEAWIELKPVQGTANPTGKLSLTSSVNGGTAVERFNADLVTGQINGWNVTSAQFAGWLPTTDASGHCAWGYMRDTDTVPRTVIGVNGVKSNNGGVFGWVNANPDASGAVVTGLSFVAAGVAAVGTGAAGSTAGDLQLRGLSFKTPFTVSTLPAASTAGDGMSYRVTDLTTPALGSAPSGSGAVHGIVTSNGTSYTVTQFG